MGTTEEARPVCVDRVELRIEYMETIERVSRIDGSYSEVFLPIRRSDDGRPCVLLDDLIGNRINVRSDAPRVATSKL